MDSQELPSIFTVGEAATYLRTSPGNIYRLFREGTLVPAKVGGRTLIRRADIDNLVSKSIAMIGTPPANSTSGATGWQEVRRKVGRPRKTFTRVSSPNGDIFA